MGFQHALAMLGGIVSVPLIVGGPFDAKLSNEEKEYLISAGLISSGLLSLIQIYRLKLGDSGYYLGTGPFLVSASACVSVISTRQQQPCRVTRSRALRAGRSRQCARHLLHLRAHRAHVDRLHDARGFCKRVQG